MEQNETPQPDYLKGFNEGYLLSKHLPDLAEKLSKTSQESIRYNGFLDGRVQLNLEQDKTRYPDWLQRDRLSFLTKNRDKPKEKDIGFPDREKE